MPNSFNCPKCAAPLEYDGVSTTTMRCHYCASNILLPEEFRRRTNHVTIDARKLGAAGLLVLTVCLVVGGLSIGFVIWSAVSATRGGANSAETPTPARGITIPVPPRSGPGATKPGFERLVMEFGSEGIGAGQFKDARSIAVDGEGRIYVGEYTGGRVQVFDAQGKFITQWMVDPKRALLNLAADRKGTVYVVHPSHILRYEGTTGNLLGEVERRNGNRDEFYEDVTVALDGSLYAIGSNSNIIQIGTDGKIKRTIDVKEKVGEDISFDKVAVSGTGDIYALESRKGVFKFSPDGRYVNRFGGEGEDGPRSNAPGQFSFAFNIAVDGRGRVYVTDGGHSIQIFDGNGHYLGNFGGSEVVFGITINDRNEVFACYRNRHTVVKFAPDAPAS